MYLVFMKLINRIPSKSWSKSPLPIRQFLYPQDYRGCDLPMTLKFKGSSWFRLSVVLSVLTGKPIIFEEFRYDCTEPGIKDYEIKFLELICELTEGTVVEINDTGTEIKFRPGVIKGGIINFDCGSEKCITYFLEPIMPLLYFSKLPSKIVFKGSTSFKDEMSMDALKFYYEPIIGQLGIKNVSLKITTRSYSPDARGNVSFECAPTDSVLKGIALNMSTSFSKVRGLLCSSNVNAQITSSILNGVKENVGKIFDDVYIYTDSKHEQGTSSGFNMVLVGTGEGSDLVILEELDHFDESIPSEFSAKISKRLMKKLAKKVAIDSKISWSILMIMSILQGVSQVQLNAAMLDTGLIDRIEALTGVTFHFKKIDTEITSVKCLGIGLKNISKGVH